MAERDAQILAFLDRHGWAGAARAVLSGDASFRRYERLVLGDRRAVLMDAPPALEDVRPFVAVARHLVSLGFSAPRVLAEDVEDGLLLLEDLGDETYTKALEAAARDGDRDAERALYALAVDVLIDLHRRPAAEAVPKGLPPYGDGRLLDEAFLLPQWYLPAMTGEPVPEPARKAYGEAWLQAFPAVHAGFRTLVLRDYHVDNLMLLQGRDGVARCGLLDFQDAVAGHPAYDLMSLLEDARRDIDPGLRDAMRTRYLDAFPDLDRDAFRQAFRILAAQRHAKVIGIFTRLAARDGKPQYLAHIPRVWRLLEAALAEPSLAPVAAWFGAHVPPDRRRRPPDPAAVA